MVIKTNRWSPDTCQCVLEYTWDDAVPQDQITITPSTVVTKCSVHAPIADNATVFTTVFDENPRKNHARQLLLDNAPSSVYDVIDVANGTREFKNGISFSWSWAGTAPNRVLVITLTGITLTTNQKNAVQNQLNTRFGTNKVTFVNN